MLRLSKIMLRLSKTMVPVYPKENTCECGAVNNHSWDCVPRLKNKLNRLNNQLLSLSVILLLATGIADVSKGIDFLINEVAYLRTPCYCCKYGCSDGCRCKIKTEDEE